MKYQWIEEIETCQELSQRLGCIVKELKAGGIVVGYEDGFDLEGNPIRIPIIKRGIELDLEEETPEILARLDRQFQSLKRKGGKNIASELDQLNDELEKIKEDVKKLKEK